jgi:multisubunit Na+/H+ antiporter MnhE subunit
VADDIERLAVRRALDPRLPLSPGFLAYRARLPSGLARDAFALELTPS